MLPTASFLKRFGGQAVRESEAGVWLCDCASAATCFCISFQASPMTAVQCAGAKLQSVVGAPRGVPRGLWGAAALASLLALRVAFAALEWRRDVAGEPGATRLRRVVGSEERRRIPFVAGCARRPCRASRGENAHAECSRGGPRAHGNGAAEFIACARVCIINSICMVLDPTVHAPFGVVRCWGVREGVGPHMIFCWGVYGAPAPCMRF